MELFKENGHISDEGFAALLAEQLDELGRLEAAEHLSFCDECLNRYTGLLTGDVLLAPEKPLAAPVLRRAKKKNGRVMFRKYGMVAAAACLAVVMCGAGGVILPQLRDKQLSDSQQPPAVQQSAGAQAQEERGWRIGDLFDGAGQRINGFLDGIRPDAGNPSALAEDNAAAPESQPETTPAAPKKDDAQTGYQPTTPQSEAEKARQEREALFDRRKPKQDDDKQDAGDAKNDAKNDNSTASQPG